MCYIHNKLKKKSKADCKYGKGLIVLITLMFTLLFIINLSVQTWQTKIKTHVSKETFEIGVNKGTQYPLPWLQQLAMLTGQTKSKSQHWLS